MNSLTVVLVALLASPTLGMFGPMMNPAFMNTAMMNPGLMNTAMMNPGLMNTGMARRNSLGNFGNLGELGNLGDIGGLLRLLNRLAAFRRFLDIDPLFDVLDTSSRRGNRGSGRQTSVGAGQSTRQSGIVNSGPNTLPQF